jgi:hypothetical protein
MGSSVRKLGVCFGFFMPERCPFETRGPSKSGEAGLLLRSPKKGSNHPASSLLNANYKDFFEIHG